jgi:hypothetical protein
MRCLARKPDHEPSGKYNMLIVPPRVGHGAADTREIH